MFLAQFFINITIFINFRMLCVSVCVFLFYMLLVNQIQLMKFPDNIMCSNNNTTCTTSESGDITISKQATRSVKQGQKV